MDANLLLYAHDSNSCHHRSALAWWRTTLERAPLAGIPWQTVGAFLRVATHPHAVRRPLTAREGVAVVDSWLQADCVRLLAPGPRHWEILRDLLVEAQVSGPLVTDARLAATALENGAVLATNDRDFLRFPSLRTVFPLGDRR